MTTVSGTVLDENGDPVSRTVRAYRRDTGELLGSSVSDGGIFSTFAEWNQADGSNSTGWGNYTLRVVVNASLIGACEMVRLTFRAASAGNSATISKAYIGEAAASGDAYDFASTPTQILFSGSAGATIAVNSSLVSDTTSFVTDGLKNLVVSIYFAAGSTDVRSKVTQSGWSGFYKSGDSAATVNESGYTSGSASYCVLKIEGSAAGVLGDYQIDCGAYADEVQVICLDNAAGTLENDLVLRTFPV